MKRISIISGFIALCILQTNFVLAEPKTTVEKLNIALQRTVNNITVFGEVKPLQEIKVASQYTGRIVSMDATIGRKLRKNDEVARLRTKEVEALIKNRSHHINDIVIVSPLSGRVVEQYIFPGEIAVTGQPLVRIISDQEKYLLLTIPGEFLYRVKEGTMITVYKKDKEYQLKIRSVIPVINQATGTFHAIAPVKNRKFYVGNVCPVTLHLSAERDSSTLIKQKKPAK